MEDNELTREWVVQLRSGKYKQGKRYLHPGDRFCCLGVLCDIVDPNGWNFPLNVGEGEVIYHFGEDEASVALLPKTVLDLIYDDDPNKDYLGDTLTLTSLNDSGYVSFAEIADKIDEYCGRSNV